MLESPFTLLFLYLLVVFIFFAQSKKKLLDSQNNFFFYVSCVLMIFVCAARGEGIGADTEDYKMSFDSEMFVDTVSYERTWIYICSFVKFILKKEFDVVILIYSLICFLPVIFVVRKETKYPYMAFYIFIVIGLFFANFNIMRQCAAMSICLYSFYLLRRKKYLFFALFCGFAILFHATASVFFFIVFATYCFSKLSYKGKIMLLLFSLMIGLLFYGVINSLAVYASWDKYQNYKEYADTKSVNFFANFLVNIIHTYWTILIYRHFKDFREPNKFSYISMYLLSVVLANLFVYNIGINRIVFYAKYSAIIAIPYLWELYCSHNLSVKISYPNTFRCHLHYYFVFLFLIYILSIFQNSNGVFPF